MIRIFVLILLFSVFSCKENSKEKTTVTTPALEETVKTNAADSLIFPEEKYFKNMRKLRLVAITQKHIGVLMTRN